MTFNAVSSTCQEAPPLRNCLDFREADRTAGQKPIINCGCGDSLPDCGFKVARNGSIRLPKCLIRTTMEEPSRIGARPRVTVRGIGIFSQFSYHVSPLRLFFEMANGPRGVLSEGWPGERKITGHKMLPKVAKLAQIWMTGFEYIDHLKRLNSYILI